MDGSDHSAGYSQFNRPDEEDYSNTSSLPYQVTHIHDGIFLLLLEFAYSVRIPRNYAVDELLHLSSGAAHQLYYLS